MVVSCLGQVRRALYWWPSTWLSCSLKGGCGSVRGRCKSVIILSLPSLPTLSLPSSLYPIGGRGSSSCYFIYIAARPVIEIDSFLLPSPPPTTTTTTTTKKPPAIIVQGPNCPVYPSIVVRIGVEGNERANKVVVSLPTSICIFSQ